MTIPNTLKTFSLTISLCIFFPVLHIPYSKILAQEIINTKTSTYAGKLLLQSISIRNVDLDKIDQIPKEKIGNIVFKDSNQVVVNTINDQSFKGELIDPAVFKILISDSPDPISIPKENISNIIIYDKHLIKQTKVTYLSDIDPSFAYTEYGHLEKDVFSLEHPIRLNHTNFKKGLYAHASSHLTYSLYQTFDTFEAYVGLWDSGNPDRGIPGNIAQKRGSVVFKIFLDGTLAYESQILDWSQSEHVHISVKGADKIDLIVEDGGNGNKYDWSIWADAKLIVFK